MVGIWHVSNRRLLTVERACLSKARFVTRREARFFARRFKYADGQVQPYHCRYGDHWHLGHRRHRRRRRATWLLGDRQM